MVSTATTNRREVLVQRDQVERLLGQLAELLDDIADADADSSWGLPAVPTDAIPDQVADLCGRMQMLFFLEETDQTLAELIELQPELRDELERLHCEHPRLLNLLDEIRELASFSRPASTWDDVESRFHRFQRALSGHQRRHDDLGVRVNLAVITE